MRTGAVTRLLTIVMQLLSVAIASRELGPAQFSFIAAALALTAISGFADLGIGNALVTPLARAFASKDRNGYSSLLLSSGIALTLIGSLIAAIACLTILAVGEQAVSRQLLGTTDTTALFIIAGSLILSIPSSIGGRILIAREQSWANSMWMLGSSIVVLFAAGVCSTVDAGIETFTFAFVGLPAIMLTVQTAYAVRAASMIYDLKLISFRIVTAWIPSSVPYLVLTAGAAITVQSNVVVIRQAAGPDEAGVFAVTIRMFVVLTTLYSPGLLQLWASVAAGTASGEVHEARRSFWLVSRVILGTAVPLGCALIILGKPLIHLWVGEAFLPSWSMLVASFCWGIANLSHTLTSFYLNAANLVRLQSVITGIVSFGSVLLAIFLTNEIGPTGAPFATAGTVFLIIIPSNIAIALKAGLLGTVGRTSRPRGGDAKPGPL